MLAWGEFDAVIIAVPPFLHKEFSIMALKADKHVLLEKPLTGNLKEAAELKKAVKNAKAVFQVGYEVRSSQLIQRLLSIIKSGSLGDVVQVWWSMLLKYHNEGWRQDRKTFGGKMFDCGCHYIDILQLLAGAPFYRVTAYGHLQGKTGPNPDEVPNVASVMLEYENGAKGTFILSDVTPTVGGNCYFGVAGTRGVVYGDPWSPEGAGSLKCQLEDGLFHETVTVNGKMASTGHLGFSEQHQAFINAIRTGKGNPCTIDGACEIELVMAAIDKSMATGKTVSRGEMPM
jgi:predicted dehydrogenase